MFYDGTEESVKEKVKFEAIHRFTFQQCFCVVRFDKVPIKKNNREKIGDFAKRNTKIKTYQWKQVEYGKNKVKGRGRGCDFKAIASDN